MAVESQKQVKRTTNPGVRVVGGRIYDSSNGKTCHQCRQKTMDFAASCKVLKRDKPCPIKYCHKCLLNRYGEKAEEVALLDEWTCPKCRGICNCSLCMKKRGHQPTGIMVHTAKATGFSSVSELLQVKGPENFVYQKGPKDISASPNKSVGLNKDGLVASPRKPGKENSFEGKCDLQSEEPQVDVKKSKKTKREGLKEIYNGNNDENAAVGKASPKRTKISAEIPESVSETAHVSKEVPKKGIDASENSKTRVLGHNSSSPVKQETNTEGNDAEVDKDVENDNVVAKIKGTKASKRLKKCVTEHLNQDFQCEAQLPQGISSITISGIDLPPEDVGSVLQFLEFCSAFGKVLDLRKGQAECVMRELLCGRSRRRQQYSLLIQMNIQLLSVILKDRGEMSPSLSPTDASWFRAVGECILESECQLDDFPSELFSKGISEYEKLEASKKLKLLNFLCDEALCTMEMRNWIDNQNLESAERSKEAKEKVTAAKEKEKQLKQKLQDEVAKAVIAKNGAPLSISEHENIVSQIKAEAKVAHAEMLEAMGMLSKKRQRCDAVRTEPVILDDNGRVFWRLQSYTGEPNILLQDMGTWDEVYLHEKWSTFNSEQKPKIEKYISCLRVKRLRAHKYANATSVAC